MPSHTFQIRKRTDTDVEIPGEFNLFLTVRDGKIRSLHMTGLGDMGGDMGEDKATPTCLPEPAIVLASAVTVEAKLRDGTMSTSKFQKFRVIQLALIDCSVYFYDVHISLDGKKIIGIFDGYDPKDKDKESHETETGENWVWGGKRPVHHWLGRSAVSKPGFIEIEYMSSST